MSRSSEWGYLRGHQMTCEDSEWVYSDTMKPTAGNPRPCGFCNEDDREDGHDACLGELPGLMNACCGHGVEEEAYVQFLDGSTVRGKDATYIVETLKRQMLPIKIKYTPAS